METQLKTLCDQSRWSEAIEFASGKPVDLLKLAETILERCPAGSDRDRLLETLITILVRMGLIERASKLVLLIHDEERMDLLQQGLLTVILRWIDISGAI